MPSNIAGGSSSGVGKAPGYSNRDTTGSRVPQGTRIRKRFASSRQYLAAINTGKKKASAHTYAQLKQAQQSTQRKQHYNGGTKKRTSTAFISPESRNRTNQHTSFTNVAGDHHFDEDTTAPYFHNSSSLNTPSKSILKSKSSYAKARPSTSTSCSSSGADGKKSKLDVKGVTAFKLGDQAGVLGSKTVHNNKPRLRWWDGVPSGNGKSTNNSTKTYDRFALGANEPNISDTTGACDPEESKVTKILCDSDYQPAENTTPSTAAKQIVSVDQRPTSIYQPLPGNLVSSPSSFSPNLSAKENSSNEVIRISLFQAIEGNNSAAEQDNCDRHRPTATSVDSSRSESVDEAGKGTDENYNKKVSEKDDSHTPSSRAIVGPQEKAQPLKKRSRQVETFRRYRRRPVRQSRSINPNDKWKHLGLHPRETMNILTNGMSIKNIKKRERNAKRRKQKAHVDQEPCKLSKRRKRKRETAVQAKSSCMPRKRRVTKAAQRTESRNRVTRRQESSRPRKSKNNNLEESKTTKQASEREKRAQRRNRLLEEHTQNTSKTIQEGEKTAQGNQCPSVSIKEHKNKQVPASVVGDYKEDAVIVATATKIMGADAERRLMSLEDKYRNVEVTNIGELSHAKPSLQKSAIEEDEQKRDAACGSGQCNRDEAFSVSTEEHKDNVVNGVGEQVAQTSSSRISNLYDDQFGSTFAIVVPIGVTSLGILVGDINLSGSKYVAVDSVVMGGYAMRTGLCQKGDVLLSVEDESGKTVDLRGMQVLQSFPYITSKHRPLRLTL